MAVLAAVAMVSCDDVGPQFERLGVRLSEAAEIQVRYLACPDERVDSVVVYELDDDDFLEPGDDDRIIQSFDDPDVADLAAGLTVRLLDPEGRYIVEVFGSTNASSEAFVLGDLATTTYRVDRQHRSEDDFLRDAGESC